MISTSVPSVFVDTNVLIYASAAMNASPNAQGYKYVQKGLTIVKTLKLCMERGFRVFSTDIAYLEMHQNYLEWEVKREALNVGAPPGLAFGRQLTSEGEMYNDLFTPSVIQCARTACEDWLAQWRFAALVEWKAPDAIPGWHTIAKRIYLSDLPSVLDCLHVAASIGLECDYLFTEDSGVRRTLDRLKKDCQFRRFLQKELGVPKSYRLPEPLRAANATTVLPAV